MIVCTTFQPSSFTVKVNDDTRYQIEQLAAEPWDVRHFDFREIINEAVVHLPFSTNLLLMFELNIFP
jgi:hypothetical protein